MKFLILLTTVLTIISCGEKAWEGCDGAEYTASVEETENIFKAESSSYDGFHCPVMEDAWPGTDSEEVVNRFIGIYTAQKAFAYYMDDTIAYEETHVELPLDEVPFDNSAFWQQFTIKSLASCSVAVAQPGEDCLDTFALSYTTDKSKNIDFTMYSPPEKNSEYFFAGYSGDNSVSMGYPTNFSFEINEESQFVIAFDIEDREYERITLVYSKD